MKKFACLVFAGLTALSAPAAAGIATVEFSGVIPRVNSYFSYTSSVYDTYTDAQWEFFDSINWGSEYNFKFQYDTTSPISGGTFAATLVSGQVGTFSDFTGFNITLKQMVSSGQQVLQFQIGRIENFSPTSNFYTFLTFNLIDYDGLLFSSVNELFDGDVGSIVDTATAEFRISRNQSGNSGYRFFTASPTVGVVYSGLEDVGPGNGDDGNDDAGGNTGNPGTGDLPGDGTAIPAPAPFGLLGLGLVVLGLRHGRRIR